ncbi:hypothetical protein LCGC14_0117690 [marine sediment metagenome]|uniref:Uncharacterized protein n=1 Tax=marine sediment metagenome TaxID=412755 RepID=A0A0F9XP59_9ZZZZ|nr:hypothetical protein [Maribacter sp.]HDZ07276.1 hypothetical protein [Maribacter sp.]
MKKHIIYLITVLLSFTSYSQLLPGTLDVSGFPSVSQDISDLVQEAGLDDGGIGFESSFDATLVGFTLDSSRDPVFGYTTTSSSNCSENVYRYKVYMHTTGAPQNIKIEARTTFNSGIRFPQSAAYDGLSFKPLGPRDLTPENGGNYILIPNDGAAAIKVFEFIGCREDIPIQFRIEANSLAMAGISDMTVYYTVVGSLD